MLVLTRKTQEQIQVGDNIIITIVRVTGQSVRVGIQAPQSVRVVRGELLGKPPKTSLPLVASDHATSDNVTLTTPAEHMMNDAAESVLTHAAPLASRCRNRLTMASTASMPSEKPAESKSCVEDRCRVPGASLAPVIRRPQRLGPASLGSMCRMR